MAVSGTAAFNYNLDQIVRSALRKIGAIAAGETPSPQMFQDAKDQLNILIKAWDATGLHIWTEEEAILFTQPSQVSYTLGGNTPDSCAATSFTQTSLTANASAGATTISVLSATGFAANYYVGIPLSTGYIFWTQESGAPSGTTINLTTPLTSAATAGSYVYVYQSQIIRPLRVLGGRRYYIPSSIDTPLIALSRIDYRNLPNKTTPGTITQYFYDPRGGAATQGVFYVWPAPTDANSAVKFTYMRPIDDFVTSANTPDLPNEWLDAIVWNLALKLALEYDTPPQRYEMLKEQAVSSLDLVMGWDREPESIYFGVNFDQR